MRQFPIQTGLAIATLGLLLAGARLVVPKLKGPAPSQLGEIVDFAPERVPVSPLTHSADPVPAPTLPKASVHGAETLLEDADGVLDHFYQALWRTEKQEDGAVTRIVHYGDSPTTADLITGDVRTQLQQHYGDAGHGFILISKPWAWYQHTGVEVSGSGWQMAPASRFISHDGMFGLGGVSFTGSGSARGQIVFAKPAYTEYEVWYLRQPGGGSFSLLADGKVLGKTETAGESKAPGFATFHSDSAAQKLEIRVDQGTVRLYGITAEKPGPGVVYDSLGLNGASITVLSKMYNEPHWAAELQHRNPALVIVNYGTNEADFAAFVDGPYEKELREALRRLHAAVPDASILVMSPMDRGHRTGPGEIETMPTIPKIVALQKRVARETACGFFDTYTAMGGEGTMARWYAAQPRLVSADLIHPYPGAGKTIAGIFTRELAAGLNRYKVRRVNQR
ncbi:MAG TPA: GDSL-type esterase/lipase family protein [Bryobacteraceae bacterium]|jgi:lysophospholipase L1-like esterase